MVLLLVFMQLTRDLFAIAKFLLIICYGKTRPTASTCMTLSSYGSGTDNKRATAGTWRLNGISFLSSKKAKTVISHLLEDDITDESDIDYETNSD